MKQDNEEIIYKRANANPKLTKCSRKLCPKFNLDEEAAGFGLVPAYVCSLTAQLCNSNRSVWLICGILPQTPN